MAKIFGFGALGAWEIWGAGAKVFGSAEVQKTSLNKQGFGVPKK